jgi:hypothetical protein
MAMTLPSPSPRNNGEAEAEVVVSDTNKGAMSYLRKIVGKDRNHISHLLAQGGESSFKISQYRPMVTSSRIPDVEQMYSV